MVSSGIIDTFFDPHSRSHRPVSVRRVQIASAPRVTDTASKQPEFVAPKQTAAVEAAVETKTSPEQQSFVDQRAGGNQERLYQEGLRHQTSRGYAMRAYKTQQAMSTAQPESTTQPESNRPIAVV